MPGPSELNLGTLYYKVRLDTSELASQLSSLRTSMGNVGGAVSPAAIGLPTAAPGVTTAANIFRGPAHVSVTPAAPPPMSTAGGGIGPYAGRVSGTFTPMGAPVLGDARTPGTFSAWQRRMMALGQYEGGLAGRASASASAAASAKGLSQHYAALASHLESAAIEAAVSGGSATEARRLLSRAGAYARRSTAYAAQAESFGAATINTERQVAERAMSEQRRIALAGETLQRGAAPWVARVGKMAGMTPESAMAHAERMASSKAARLQAGGMGRADAIERAAEQVAKALLKSAQKLDAAGDAAAKRARQAAETARRTAEHEIQSRGPFRQWIGYRGMASAADSPVQAARYRALASQAWRNSNVGRFLGPPSGMGLYFSAVFGGWELSQAMQSILGGAREASRGRTVSDVIGGMASGIEGAMSGPLGGLSSMVQFIGWGGGPIAEVHSLRMAEQADAAGRESRDVRLQAAAVRLETSAMGGGAATRRIKQLRAAEETRSQKRKAEVATVREAMQSQEYLARLSRIDEKAYAESEAAASDYGILGAPFTLYYRTQRRFSAQQAESYEQGAMENRRRMRDLEALSAAEADRAKREIEVVTRERRLALAGRAQDAADIELGRTFGGAKRSAMSRFWLDASRLGPTEARAELGARWAAIAREEKDYNTAGAIALRNSVGMAAAGDLAARGFSDKAAIMAASVAGATQVAQAVAASRYANPAMDPHVQAAQVAAFAAVGAATTRASRNAQMARMEASASIAASRLRVEGRPLDATISEIRSRAEAAALANPEQAGAIRSAAAQQEAEARFSFGVQQRDIVHELQTRMSLANARILGDNGGLAQAAISIGQGGIADIRKLRESQMWLPAALAGMTTMRELESLRAAYLDSARPTVTGAHTYFDTATAGGEAGLNEVVRQLEQVGREMESVKMYAAQIAMKIAGLNVVN